ncbi:glycosyltransferase family 4 protein [Sinomonas sp. B1-1]|uniref:glycosyltransferase family 4 protein n=1 Tax=Sinomonas sp. B1-1 TaxID=3141454 RepID=UPI003D2A88FB
MSRKAAPSLTQLLLSWRNRGYQRQVLKFHDRYRPRVIIAQYTAAREIFAAADASTIRILSYPIAHHAWLDRSMREEGERNPRWAALLQGHDLAAEDIALLDEEIELADVVVVPSTFAAQTFIDSGINRDKLVVVPLGCDFLDLSEIHSASAGPDQGFRVLYAGQVTQRKGVGYLVEAVEELEGVHLELVGGCTPMARNLISRFSRTAIYPSLPREELLLRMRASSVLVLPSLAEGFGLVALEAMSVGCPVILSHQTFAGDIVLDGRNGFLLPTVDKESIRNKLTEVMSAPDLDRVAHEGARTAKTYSWDRYAGEFTSVLDDLLAQRN